MSFDRVASIYDATRGIPEGVLQRVVERVVEATNAGPDTRFLEIGVGTGRIAMPFVKRGYNYTGVDISPLMLDKLREKAGSNSNNLTLLQTNITELPLPDQSVDVVIAVHVLHLVPEWKKALDEVRRVLTPAGHLVVGHHGGKPGNPADEIESQWRAMIEETGTRLPSNRGTVNAVQDELTARGSMTAEFQAAQWTHETRPIDVLEGRLNRVYSASWEVPQDVLELVHEKMTVWCEERFGDLKKPLPVESEFIVSVSRFP